MMKLQTDSDVIIIGGGLVGLSLAAMLLRGGLRVIVLDNSNAPLPTPVALHDAEFDQRVFAISRASENIFRALPNQTGSVWDAMQAQRTSAYQDMHVWENSGAIHFSGMDIFEENLGHIIEQQVMLVALQEALQKQDNLQLLRPAQWQAFTIHEDRIELLLQNGELVTAKLLIGADGARSQVREQAGINWQSRDYGHHALVATVRTELSHEKTAWQRFLPTGPLAFLPLTEAHTSSIVWSTHPDKAQALLSMPKQDFQQALAQAFAEKLGMVESVRGRAVFPLVRRHAKQYVQPRLALVGDSLRTIHPLAGQGVNLGLLDAATLAEVLIDAHEKRRDVGHYWVLRRYERWRKGHNLLMLTAMDGFKQLFSNGFLPLSLMRNLGLGSLNQNKLFKQSVMLQAMGINGDLPKLARWSGATL